jgi:hypothetical protein
MKSVPSHDDGRSQTFQNLLVLGGSLIKFQNCRRLGHPLGAHVFRYSHARIALSGHGSATLVIPPRDSRGVVVAHISLMVFSCHLYHMGCGIDVYQNTKGLAVSKSNKLAFIAGEYVDLDQLAISNNDRRRRH